LVHITGSHFIQRFFYLNAGYKFMNNAKYILMNQSNRFSAGHPKNRGIIAK